jgi:hypothetical protein
MKNIIVIILGLCIASGTVYAAEKKCLDDQNIIYSSFTTFGGVELTHFEIPQGWSPVGSYDKNYEPDGLSAKERFIGATWSAQKGLLCRYDSPFFSLLEITPNDSAYLNLSAIDFSKNPHWVQHET